MSRGIPAEAIRAMDPAIRGAGPSAVHSNGCSFSHGKDLRGGSGGPSLLRSQRLLRDRDGETIGEVILKGVPNTAMPTFPLAPEEFADLAEFLHSVQLSRTAATHRPTSAVIGIRGQVRSSSIVTVAGAMRVRRSCGNRCRILRPSGVAKTLADAAAPAPGR